MNCVPLFIVLMKTEVKFFHRVDIGVFPPFFFFFILVYSIEWQLAQNAYFKLTR